MNKNTRIVNSSKYPIRFERQHPGSLFVIVAEPSRGIRHSKDARVYRKALDHEGFYAYNSENDQEVAILMPSDLVQPVRLQRIK